VVAPRRRDLTAHASAAGAGPLLAEGITIGNEILSGRTVDTNFAFLARTLEASGARMGQHQTVPDTVEAIGAALQQALGRARLVVLTGGLGPTPDDLTRKAIAQALNRPLSLDPRILEQLRARWEQRGGRTPMPANNEQQALVPRGAETIANPVGSAPGLYLDVNGVGLFVLPGVPLEMETMCRAAIVPWVKERAGRAVEYVTVRTVGIWESVLAERIADLAGLLPGHAIAYLPSFGSVDVRVTLPAGVADTDAARAEVRSLLLERLGGYVYAEGDDTLESTVGSLLASRGLWLSVAESCTGGLLAGRITSVPGSSGWFERGVVVYSNESKTELAGVPAELIEQHGAVSEPVARALARGIAERSGTAVGLGVTGIAGPAGGTSDKPVGTVHVAAFAPEGEAHRLLRLSGSRSIIRERSTMAALDVLRRLLLGLPETAKPD
jgi:nicotinamide-nucleotide amidase